MALETSPATTKAPFAIASLPWLTKVTPRFKKVPPQTVYIVAICSMVAFRAALSDCKGSLFVSKHRNEPKLVRPYTKRERDNNLQYSDSELQISGFKLFHDVFYALDPVRHGDRRWSCRDQYKSWNFWKRNQSVLSIFLYKWDMKEVSYIISLFPYFLNEPWSSWALLSQV